MIRKRWVSSIISGACLLLGSVLLLSFMQFYIVPHVLTSMFKPTSCQFLSICPEYQSLIIRSARSPSVISPPNLNVTRHPQPWKIPTEQMDEDQDQFVEYQKQSHASWPEEYYREEVCFRISKKVFKYASNRSPKYSIHNSGDGSVNSGGKLQHTEKKAKAHEQENLTVKGSKSILDMKLIEQIKRLTKIFPEDIHKINMLLEQNTHYHLGSLMPLGSTGCPLVAVRSVGSSQVATLLQDSWAYYTHSTHTAQCSCPDCKLEPRKGFTFNMNHEYIGINQTFPCYVNPAKGSEIIWERTSTFIILNVMLWPTILIIVGFVGAFFSWLYLQYDHWQGYCFYKTV